MKPNRREFMATAGAGAIAQSPAQFRPAGAPRKLLDNLLLYEDTANVYVVRNGNRAVLIDFGSGGILEHLPALGITKVDWVLHTHHHRDQCQGDHKAVAGRIPIAVPAHEHDQFAEAENFWRNRRVFHLYNMRNDFNTVTRNIPVERRLEDYTTLRWGDVEFFVQPAPGHTPGSIALIAAIDGKRVAFTGDLLYAPGRIVNLYDTQINYGGWEGIDLANYSLARLREQRPDLLCPSHGEPMPDADGAIGETIQRLSTYHRFHGGEPSITHKPLPVSPHLVAHHLTTASFYAIVSDSGKAMFIDYGSASQTHFSTFEKATSVSDRIRFVEHSIDELRRSYGVKSVDVAIPSHIHDDHVNGFPHLKRRYGTRLWCYENMTDIFQNPRGYNLGCILGEPMKVDRTFRHGERFRWEEFDFEMTHSPGHSEHQMALYVTIDGKRVAFTGDAFFEGGRDGAMRHNLIFRNHVESDSHVKSIRSLIEHEPEVICPGHGRPFAVARPLMDATLTRLTKQEQLFRDILPEGETNFGLDPSWVSLYPYQLLIAPGARQSIEVRVRNYRPEPMKAEIALLAPSEWRIAPAVQRLEAPAGAMAAGTFEVSVPRTWAPPSSRFAIAADVMANGKYLGQITEAVVEVPHRREART